MNILIYSNYCKFSNQFTNILQQVPQLMDEFKFLNIDEVDKKTGRRPKAFYDIQAQLNYQISEVPTVIVSGGEYVLSGEEAFKWLEYEVENRSNSHNRSHNNNRSRETELNGFNPNEMGAFSDSYAPLHDTSMNNASEQSFKFINKPDDQIETPPEDSVVTSDEYTRKQKERDAMMSNSEMPMREHFQQARDYVDRPVPKMNAVNNNVRGGNPKSAKQNEIDARYQELLMQRDEMTPPPNKQRKMNFSRRAH